VLLLFIWKKVTRIHLEEGLICPRLLVRAVAYKMLNQAAMEALTLTMQYCCIAYS
jgi:hypothetical protein